MMRRFAPVLLCGVMGALTTPARAHHSFAMFDAEHPIVLEGAVKEYKYTSPHSFIVLIVAGKDGETTTWTLEGVSPAELGRSGWSSKVLKPGDEIRVKLAPFRSGVPGGSWRMDDVKFRDGSPIVVTH